MSGLHHTTLDGRTVSRGGSAGLGLRLAEIWRFRHLLVHLIRRDLKVKYQRSSLGFLWTILNPLFTVAVLAVVFGTFVRLDVERYWAFLLSGYFAWNTVSQSITTASYVLPQHARLTRSVALPKEILVLAAVLTKGVEFAAELGILLVVLAVAHHGGLPASFLLVPVLLVLQLALSLGVALTIATLSTLYTDVIHALPIALTSLFYLTPVFYPLRLVPEAVRPFLLMNPFAALLTLYHTVLYDGAWPDPGILLAAGAAAGVMLAVGIALFHRYEDVCSELV